MNKLGITIGDPAGVGPELTIKLSKDFKKDTAYILYGEEATFRKAMELTGIELSLQSIEDPSSIKDPGVYLISMNISDKEVPQPSITSGKVAVAYLARAVVDAVMSSIDGILTMPINKFWAHRAGFSYEGQTEYLAQATNVKNYAMMMYSDHLKVVLLTTHIPIREVPSRLTKDILRSRLELIFSEYKRLFGAEPSVGVLGLNPHAGEMGEIGGEDMEVILPVVDEFKKRGLSVEGPLVPDTAFLRREEFDLLLCMYHDQGLIPFKLLAFKEGVNLTLGIPFPRTSPDHGTAYDIAWKGIADPTPSFKALELLEKLVDNLKV